MHGVADGNYGSLNLTVITYLTWMSMTGSSSQCLTPATMVTCDNKEVLYNAKRKHHEYCNDTDVNHSHLRTRQDSKQTVASCDIYSMAWFFLSRVKTCIFHLNSLLQVWSTKVSSTFPSIPMLKPFTHLKPLTRRYRPALLVLLLCARHGILLYTTHHNHWDNFPFIHCTHVCTYIPTCILWYRANIPPKNK